MKNILKYSSLLLFLISFKTIAQTPATIVKGTLNNTYTVTGNVSLFATQSITLLPNTWIKAGSTFVASIKSDAYIPVAFSDGNYVFTRTFQKPMTTVTGIINNADAIESIAYFDGLGRPIQNIAIKASPSKQDLVTHISYDDFGRQDKDYLPFMANSGSTASFRVNADNSTNAYYAANYPADSNNGIPNPFSQKLFEASPLNRILQQAAPGKDWAVGTGHEIKMEYQTNTLNEVKLFTALTTWNPSNEIYDIELENPAGNVFYNTNELYKNITKDENWSATQPYQLDHTTQQFTDKQGKIVLKKTFNLNQAYDTYYVYDSYGNLTYIIPPKAEGVINADILTNLCYQYKYDNRNRLVEKKLPGKNWEYIVYDKLDRPILTQDANLRAANKWLFTKYDAFSRPVYTGEYTNATQTTRKLVQDLANGTILFENKTAAANPVNGTIINYTNLAFPNSGINIFTTNYYDNYLDVDLDGGIAVASYTITPITNAKGLPTVSKVLILGTGTWITSVNYYDSKGRGIYNYSKNNFLSTVNTSKIKLDFTGKILETTTTHRKGTAQEIVLIDNFTYDHMGRLLDHKQKINNQTQEIIVTNTYDDLGQLIAKAVGGTTTPLQTVNYKYNIRGWLKNINDVNNIGNDLFAFQINYNDITDTSKKLFNGNISQTIWKTANTDTSIKNYVYTYDALNRLRESKYSLADRYNENLTYDKNGNITSLLRNGYKDANATQLGVMDNLVYTYDNGNKLFKVDDSSGSTEGFNDGSTSNQEYTYDDNGNMKTDKNKGILNIEYNHLNLPTAITLSQNDRPVTILYKYDALGTKLEKVAIIPHAQATSTIYDNGFQYLDGVLQFFPQAEGYVSNNAGVFDYIYQYKDHLGNVRLTYDKNLKIVEESNYYPFGLKQKVAGEIINNSNYKYKYNGKELQDELGLNEYDYGFRYYMPDIGRWGCIDPLAEKSRRWSTYNYCVDNPIRFVDPDGREIVNIEGGVRFTGNDAKIAFTALKQQMDNGGVKGFHLVSQEVTPNIYEHTLNSFRNGKPNFLHYDSNKENQAKRRNQAIKDYPSRGSEGLQRDEYPYASTEEGGTGADVAYVPSKENSSQGGSLGALYKTLKSGDGFLVLPLPRDKEPDAVPDAVPVFNRIPVPSPEQVNKVVKPAVTTATILMVIGMILLSPIGI